MNTLNIKLLKNEKAEKPMRNILGINNIPRIINQRTFERDCEIFKTLNFAHIRFHDAPIENHGQYLIDIHRIFPLFHLDETKEENYIFAQTDDYLRYLEKSDAEIDFRLGETIDHSKNARLIQAPIDVDKWARVCRNIIGHYKNGEMNGMHLNITRVSVWEEPNNYRLFAGTIEQYVEMFCKVYKLLKRDFPDLKIMGPSTMMPNPVEEYNEKFLMMCKEYGVVPDYLATTLYKRDVDKLKESILLTKNVMEKCGYPDMKYMLTEWHYEVRDWDRAHHMRENGFDTSENAAYVVSCLIEMMNIDFLETAYYYAWATTVWGPFNYHTPGEDLMPVYYGLLYFQKLASECIEQVPFKVDAQSPVRVLAGKTNNGKVRILLSMHDCDDYTINLDLGNVHEVLIKTIDYQYIESDCIDGKVVESDNGVFTLNHTGRHSVYLVEFDLMEM